MREYSLVESHQALILECIPFRRSSVEEIVMAAWEYLPQTLVFFSIVGYCFVVANALIGAYNIRDLNRMKGDTPLVTLHKAFGLTETFLFYGITFFCVLATFDIASTGVSNLFTPVTRSAHVILGGILAVVLFTPKPFIATFKKDIIYKYGKYLGPMGFIGWSLAFWTGLANFYLFLVPVVGVDLTILPPSIVEAGVIPIIVGAVLFIIVLQLKSKSGQAEAVRNEIAFILHGVTFGYEKAARDLVGAPALFKYVYPRTSQFLERLMKVTGFNMKKIEKMNLHDALEEFAKIAAKIGMAEQIKISWESEKVFSIESVYCSTANVRSYMTREELANAICPWAIMTAAIANKITGKEISADPSEFNEIGAKTKLKIVDEE
jgi:hypothetical protein